MAPHAPVSISEIDEKCSTQSSDSLSMTRQITLQLSSEQYERLFFQPTKAYGDLSKRLGNPTLLGLIGFLIPFQATVFSLLQATTGSSSASMVAFSGSFYVFGGFGMILSGICEFILGNTFPFAVFVIYGAHWVNVGYTLSPSAALTSVYAKGALDPSYNAGSAWYNATMAAVSLVFLVGSVRTNVPFVIIFFTLVVILALFSAADFYLAAYGAQGLGAAAKMLQVAGGFGMVTTAMGWYLALITTCAATGVPCPLPVFDLSSRVFAKSQAAMNEAAGAGGSAVVAEA